MLIYMIIDTRVCRGLGVCQGLGAQEKRRGKIRRDASSLAVAPGALILFCGGKYYLLAAEITELI